MYFHKQYVRQQSRSIQEMSKVVDGPRVGLGLEIDSLSFLKLSARGLGSRTFELIHQIVAIRPREIPGR